MQPSDHLSRLIHSMTKGERRVFQQQSKVQSGNKAYVKLYRLMVRRKFVNEDKTMQQMGLKGKHQSFYNLRSYLQRHILKSLVIHSDGPEIQIEKKIISAKILIRKGIYSLARKIILPALDQARKEERFLHAVELSRLFLVTQRSFRNKSNPKSLRQYDIMAYRKDTYIQFKNWFLYESYFEQFVADLKVFRTHFSVESLLGMEKLRKNPIFQNEKSAISARSKRCYWGFQYLLAMQEGRFQDAFEICGKRIKLFENHPFLINDHFGEYASMKYHSGRLMLVLGKIEGCKQLIDGGLNIIDVQDSTITQIQLNLLRLYYAITTGDRMIGMEAIKYFDYEQNPHGAEHLEGMYAIAYFLISLGEPQQVGKWVTKLNNRFLYCRKEAEKWTGTDLKLAARILNLVIAYDLEDVNLLQHAHQAAYRYLYIRGLLGGYWGQFIRTVNGVSSQPLLEQRAYFDRAIGKLEGVLEDPAEGKLLIYFDGLAWLKGKRGGKT